MLEEFSDERGTRDECPRQLQKPDPQSFFLPPSFPASVNPPIKFRPAQLFGTSILLATCPLYGLPAWGTRRQSYMTQAERGFPGSVSCSQKRSSRRHRRPRPASRHGRHAECESARLSSAQRTVHMYRAGSSGWLVWLVRERVRLYPICRDGGWAYSWSCFASAVASL